MFRRLMKVVGGPQVVRAFEVPGAHFIMQDVSPRQDVD